MKNKVSTEKKNEKYNVAQNLKLKVLWLKNSLGLGIDQVNMKHQFPLTQYYFWPKTDAWEQIKVELMSKIWIEERERIYLLNNVSDIINYWQTNRKKQNLESVKSLYKEIEFVGSF